MKEFIEKLLGRLEKQKEEYKENRANTHCVITETSECDSCRADHYLYARLRCIDRTIEIVNQLAEEYNNGWISVEERLPEKNGQYLVQNIRGEICVAHYNYNSPCTYRAFFTGYTQVKNVIAWQQLPEPYSLKEGDTE